MINALTFHVGTIWNLSGFPTYRELSKSGREWRDLLPGVTEKVLTSQLRQLQADGVLARKATADVPPKVTYFLTREGQKLVPLMEGLCSWCSKHFGIKPTLTHAS